MIKKTVQKQARYNQIFCKSKLK